MGRSLGITLLILIFGIITNNTLEAKNQTSLPSISAQMRIAGLYSMEFERFNGQPITPDLGLDPLIWLQIQSNGNTAFYGPDTVNDNGVFAEPGRVQIISSNSKSVKIKMLSVISLRDPNALFVNGCTTGCTEHVIFKGSVDNEGNIRMNAVGTWIAQDGETILTESSYYLPGLPYFTHTIVGKKIEAQDSENLFESNEIPLPQYP